jgi:hypothetical protein
MEQEKDYNFFIIGNRAKGIVENKTDEIEIIVTSSLGEGKYNKEEIDKFILDLEKFSKESGGYLKIFQDDGENFWSIYSRNIERLDIGNEKDNYKKWDTIRSDAKQINIKDLINLCEAVALENTDTNTKK